MITKMTKYSLIVLSSDLDDFLVKLQDLGIMDITRSKKAIDDTSKEMLNLSLRYRTAINKLSKLPKEYAEILPVKTNLSDGELLSTIENTFSLKEEMLSEVVQLKREYQDALPWGDFSDNDIQRLRSLDFEPHFFTVSSKNFKERWREEFPLHILAETDGKIYFTILQTKEDKDFRFPVQEAKFPTSPASDILQKIEEKEKVISIISGKIAGFTSYITRLTHLKEELASKLDLYFASAASLKEGENTISLLEGFAPKCDNDKISQFLDATDAYYIFEDAKAEDNTPVKLKNNWFSKLFEPVGSLYSLPKYDELDLTPYFAPFYMLFFGLCLGDMGYGLILVVGGIIVSVIMPKMKGYAKLVMWLGVGSILMPLLSGTFFGMKLSEIFPSMPENIKGMFFSDMKMFWFAILFGIFQILFAKMLHAIDCISRKKWDPALTNIGWCLILVWCTAAYAGSMNNTSLIPPTLGYVIAGIGLLLVLFCSKPSKKFYLRPLKGIVSLYDITGIFGDILSYIRLFGLGTTGGILALVINSIAMQFTNIPYIGWLFTIIMLIIGHIAVMGLSCLGAFVHPVRLTFVEFYKNAEFQGGGREYKPLKSINNKNNN